MTTQRWLHRSGTLAGDGWDVVVDDRLDGWQHTGLRVGAGDALALPAGGLERLVVPLVGPVDVELHGEATGRRRLAGRPGVLEGATDVLYLPAGVGATISAPGRVAVAEARASGGRPVQHIAADSIPVELRGAGRASRQVHDVGTPGVVDAERLIVCEVVTPAGNWSSYPPHKHDQDVPGHESRLEEIYYFESAPTRGAAAPQQARPFGWFRAYGSSAGAIEIDAEVGSGDVALVPHGYHGPAAAAPGYDLYYLNVMAGEGDRVWRIADDPAHTWVRQGWQFEQIDERLPYTRGA